MTQVTQSGHSKVRSVHFEKESQHSYVKLPASVVFLFFMTSTISAQLLQLKTPKSSPTQQTFLSCIQVPQPNL